MRVNIYAEEMTDLVEIIEKEVEGNKFTAVRFYLQLPSTFVHQANTTPRPATINDQFSVDSDQAEGGYIRQYQAPFIHHPGDDDSSAVTFWGKKDLRVVLQKAIDLLDDHYRERDEREAGNLPAV